LANHATGPARLRGSPYASTSAFAGNISLISPEKLVESAFLIQSDLDETIDLAPGPVDFAKVECHKRRLLERAFHTFSDRLQADGDLRSDYATVVDSLSTWLEDYALYAALKDAHEGSEWCSWSAELAMREQDAIAQARRDLAERIEEQRFFQYLFFRQWLDLKRHANQAGIRILGDLPIFVAHDSADVWSPPVAIDQAADGRPVVVAGVPPDAFSTTGQRWGNPLYAWERLREDGFTWWIDRVRETLKLVDVVRLDHFRGFAACWEVPAEDATAENGRWADVPGSELFGAIKDGLEVDELPVIAEDLGMITPDVHSLRDACGFTGMRVLQFAFSSDSHDTHLPARVSAQRGGLHRDARQRYGRRLVSAARARRRERRGAPRARELPAVYRWRRPGDQLGLHPRRSDVGGGPRYRTGPGRARPRRERPHEYPGAGGRQLDVEARVRRPH
jgi:4-alpha-glucanotransferase